MNRKLILLLALLAPLAGARAFDPPSPQRQQEILYLLHQDCGACHGMRLRGGLGPALTPDNLQALSVEQLGETILHGRPGTPMPPWKPFLTRNEAFWLAGQLKRGVEK